MEDLSSREVVKSHHPPSARSGRGLVTGSYACRYHLERSDWRGAESSLPAGERLELATFRGRLTSWILYTGKSSDMKDHFAYRWLVLPSSSATLPKSILNSHGLLLVTAKASDEVPLELC